MTKFRTFTDAERAALTLHGLDTRQPSQLSDAFVIGMRHAAAVSEAAAAKPTELPPLPELYLSEHTIGRTAGRTVVCELSTARIVGVLAAASLPPSRELLLRAAALLSERMPCADPKCRVADDSATQRCYDDLCRAASLPPWTHSSALGKPDEHFTGFTTDEAYARKHDNPRPVYAAGAAAPLPDVPSDEREAFEAWAGDQGFPLRRLEIFDGASYQDLRTQGVWDAWQARAALAASLPPFPQRYRWEQDEKDSTSGYMVGPVPDGEWVKWSDVQPSPDGVKE